MVFYTGTGFILNRNIVFKYKDRRRIGFDRQDTKAIELYKRNRQDEEHIEDDACQ